MKQERKSLHSPLSTLHSIKRGVKEDGTFTVNGAVSGSKGKK